MGIDFRLVALAVCVWSGALALAASRGAVYLEESALLLITGVVIAFGWLLVSWLRVEVWQGKRSCVWIALPVVGVIAVVVSETSAPLTARLWLCEGDMRTYAENAEPTQEFTKSPRKVGLFSTARVRRQGQTVLLQTCHDSFNEVGVAYSPNNPPNYSPRTGVWASFTHLYGPWYRYEFPDKGGG